MSAEVTLVYNPESTENMVPDSMVDYFVSVIRDSAHYGVGIKSITVPHDAVLDAVRLQVALGNVEQRIYVLYYDKKKAQQWRSHITEYGTYADPAPWEDAAAKRSADIIEAAYKRRQLNKEQENGN